MTATQAGEPDYSFSRPFKKQPLDLKLPFTCTATKSQITAFGWWATQPNDSNEIIEVHSEDAHPFNFRVAVFGEKAEISGVTMYGLLGGTNDGMGGHMWFEVINDNGYMLILQNNREGLLLQLDIDVRRGAFVFTKVTCDGSQLNSTSISGIAKND